jgi:hypothetical protein
MIQDPFDLLGELDEFGSVVFSDEAWAQVASVLKRKLGRDVNALTVMVLGEPIPLRWHIEATIGSYQWKVAFMRRYPARTARQIAPALERLQRLLRDLKQCLVEPEVALYGFDWGNDRGGPKSAIAFIDAKLREVTARLDWLYRLRPNEPFPGLAAPRDVEPAQGWQRQHRALADDPERDLIRSLLMLYEESFRRKPAITENGPAFAYLQVLLSPLFGDLTDGKIRYWLRRKR